MLGKLIAPEIHELIASGRLWDLRAWLKTIPPTDLAELMADLPENDTAVIFRILPRSTAADTFEYLELVQQERILKALGHEQVVNLLNEMAPDDRTLLLEELPARVTTRLLSLLSPEELGVAKSLLGYPEESIGRRMTPDFLAVREEWTISQVLEFIRTHGQDKETLNVLYVIDNAGRLIDDIRAREFLLAPLEKRVSDLMDRRFVALRADDDQEIAVVAFKKHDRTALPVTDSTGVLIGIVTVDDVLDVAEQEATEDIQRLGGMQSLDLPYMSTRLAEMVQKRAGWLVILFLGEMLTATAMGYFEAEIAQAVVLALFVPLIISSGGNSGSQAASLIIRAMALGEVTLTDWWRVMRREIISGLALGAILGTIGFLRISVWSSFSDLYGPHWLLLAFTVGGALVGVVLWGTLAGAMMPLIMKRLGADPAASSAPFVATLVDVTGLIIYFSVAAVILRGSLL